MYKYAVFQGGGVKGIALVGALKRIEETGFIFDGVGGTSAGAIVAALYASGYTATEMKALFETTAFEKLLDKPFSKLWNLLNNKGFYSGELFYNWIYTRLKEKNIETFSDLGSTALKVVASDVTNRTIIVFDKENSPTMKIAEAVRMSMSIPFIFCPYKFGEKLVVDGGILSNYPLSIFENEEKTVGFKLVPDKERVPFAPKKFVEYVGSIASTMMDAHDKRDEKRLMHQQISIPDGGVPTTKFNLSDTEKRVLFGNGHMAASAFLSKNVLGSQNSKLISIEAPFSDPIRVTIPFSLKSSELIRVSISGLFRIVVDSKYLLVKGRKFNQFQPVGGVFKRLPRSSYVLSQLGVLDDQKYPLDHINRNDLRVRVPFKNLPNFLEWYRTETGRETSPEREFKEELVETEILSKDTFKYIFWEHLRTNVVGICKSRHMNCLEVLIAEIYELHPTPDQERELLDTMTRQGDDFIWCDETVINNLGFDPRTRSEVGRISESSSWLLQLDTRCVDRGGHEIRGGGGSI